MRFYLAFIITLPFLLSSSINPDDGFLPLTDNDAERIPVSSVCSSDSSVEEATYDSVGPKFDLSNPSLQFGVAATLICSTIAALLSYLGIDVLHECAEHCPHTTSSINDLTRLFAWTGTSIGIFLSARPLVMVEDTTTNPVMASVYMAIKCVVLVIAQHPNFSRFALETFQMFFWLSLIDASFMLLLGGLLFCKR